MSDYDSDDDMPFTLETRRDLYEPEDTEEKRLHSETECCVNGDANGPES